MSIANAKLDKHDVVDFYTQTAPVYDVWGLLAETRARKRSLSLAQVKDGEVVLEVAVGTGLTFQEILKANPHGKNIGIDLTPAMLAKAKARLGNRAPQIIGCLLEMPITSIFQITSSIC